MKLTCVVLPLALVVACGGGSSAGAANKADKADKAAYLKKAEAICATANADTKNLKTPQAAADLAPYVAKVVGFADTATASINALTLPPRDAADLRTKVLDPLKTQLAQAHEYAAQVAAANRAKDDAALTRLTLQAPTGSKADLTWMRHYGFSECVDAANVGG